jgi:putative transposase
MRIFAKQRDFEAFEEVIAEAKERLPMRVLAWCVLSNDWHFVLWPRGAGDLSEFMRPLTVTHTQRPHAAHRTSGTGPLYQGRFKSFPIQEDDHLWTVLRYVERKGVAGQYGQGGRGMALVESLGSGAWRRGGTAG